MTLDGEQTTQRSNLGNSTEDLQPEPVLVVVVTLLIYQCPE